ncbi:MAG TPA: metallophosphoesterase [Methanoculleus sp.]|nr:metallophosphoesterase [Methanoculleus sp.]
MRFVHIADTHLGLAAFHKIDPETGMNLRERLIYDNFGEGIEVIIRQRPDALVHAGDLFDRVRPKTRAYTTVLEALGRLGEEEIPFVVIAGNHSMPKTRYTSSPLEVLEYHQAEVHAAYRYRYELVEIGDTVFHLIPNMLRAEDYAEAYRQITPSSDRRNVLVTHGLVSTLHDYRLRTVAEHELSAGMLSSDFDYIALGHFHGQRQVADNAWYAGSLEYCSYGELPDVKGGLVVDTATGQVEHLELPHTPMMDLGTVGCEGLSAAEVSETIAGKIDRYPKGCDLAMCQLTLEGIARETVRAVDRRTLAEFKRRVLDLKVRVRMADEQTNVIEEKDLRTVDYLGEFETFVAQKHLDPPVHAFVVGRGTNVLRRVVERHQEERDAAH